ncbi:proteasome regulatory particle base subunit [Tulasnella sp. 427]|nr:proteasome regulatory particle base subunit [Tulasnella sp. 427]
MPKWTNANGTRMTSLEDWIESLKLVDSEANFGRFDTRSESKRARTTSDLSLPTNLNWHALAGNWADFSATASLGVINEGNIWNAMRLPGPYLPNAAGDRSGGVNWEGGALYNLGLINIGRGKDILDHLGDRSKEASSEVVQHGAALGLGLAGMAKGKADAYEDLRTTLFQDSTAAEDASRYAIGLLVQGNGSERCVDEMLWYARDTQETQDEKIVPGSAIGVAFTSYGRQEEAYKMDLILRYGGDYTLARSCAGIADSAAVKKLLHITVSDTSDDMRRAAVTCLAFLLFKNPARCLASSNSFPSPTTNPRV